mmetsp:Transcript_10493/g.17597  ORF Transcript_10493/g.17597 Transcript_10493/m.17597 type:complete len:159 (-) Transcript_10493:113-589(-)
MGGYLADKYEKKSYMTMPYLVMGSSFLACPLMCGLLLNQNDFWLSMGLLAGHFAISEAWFSPTVTMLQNTTSIKNQGFAVSVWVFGILSGGIFGSTSLGYLQQFMDAANNPSVYGNTLAAFIGGSYLLSVPLFYKAGLKYKEVRESQDREIQGLSQKR